MTTTSDDTAPRPALRRARFVEVERLPGSLRGEGGFGSTGFGEHKSGVNA